MALLLVQFVSLALGLSALSLGEDITQVLAGNKFPEGTRETAIVGVLLAVALGPVCAFAICERTSARTALLWAKLLAPLIPIGLAPLLLAADFWFRNQLEFLLLLGGFSILCEASFRSFFAALPSFPVSLTIPSWLRALANSKRLPLLCVVVASFAYAGLTGYLTILDHHRFGCGAFDMGIFDNLMFNALRGDFFQSSVMYGAGPGNSIAGHSEFAMVLFAPLYALYPSSEGLLAIQALTLGLAAVPLYLFAARHLRPWSALIISIGYLLYAPLHGAQYYDFHWLPMALPFFFLLFYGLSAKKKRIIVPAALMLFLLREDLAPGLILVGLFLLFTGARPKFGAALTASSAAWFALVKFVIMPAFGTWFFAELYSKLMVPGEPGYGSVLKTLLSNPVFAIRHMLTTPKFIYILHILVPLAFLPVRRGAFLLLAVPGIFFTVLTNWSAAFSIRFHYSTHFTPYLFAALVLFLSLLNREAANESGDGSEQSNADPSDAAKQAQKRRSLLPRALAPRAAAGLVAFSFTLLIHSTVFGLILHPDTFIGGIQPVAYSMTEAEKARLAGLKSLAKLIPDDASVTATDFIVPHISNRADIYAIGQRRDVGEYLFLDPTHFPAARTRKNVRTLMEKHPYRFVAQAGIMTLWKQGHEPSDPKEAKKARQLLERQLGMNQPKKRGRKPPRRSRRPRQKAPAKAPAKPPKEN